MDNSALFCDGTAGYVIPAEPKKCEHVKLRFRTKRDDVDAVSLVTKDDVYIMSKVETKGLFDYYEIDWQLGEEVFSYCFKIESADDICFYNRCGVAKEWVDYYVFTIVPGFSTPTWAKGAVMYQIFVDRFYNGDPSNDVEDHEYLYIGQPSQQVKDWNQNPEAMDIRRFYGGDLQGVLEKLDYLQDLGVEVIYFNPLFVSPSNHKYDIQDYDYIDPHYGKIINDGGEPLSTYAEENVKATMYQKRTGAKENLEASNQLFVKLVEEIHRRGMRVILDGVFNHCGSFNKWMDKERIYEQQCDYEKGAYVSADSPYREFFYFQEKSAEHWPYNGSYAGWWGHDTLPKLNYESSPKLEQYIMDIAKKWVSPPYNVDGWRLDVAADLGQSNEYNHLFWKRFRQEVKSVRPDALILAEHYGDPTEWLQGDEWDTVMNYDAFMEPLTWFLTGMEKHSDERRIDLWGNADNFINTMKHYMSTMLTPSLQVAMNELSNHDHSRFLTRTNHMVGRVEQLGGKAAEDGVVKAVMREAVAVQMTWPGAPTVYYGDEAGVCGFTDPDNRRTYPWGAEDQELLSFHKEMIRIHKSEQLLRTGSLCMLYGEENILAYGRFQQDEQVIVVLNNSTELREILVPVWKAEVPMTSKMERLIYSYEEGYTTEKDEYLIQNGELVLNMGRHSVVVMRTKKRSTAFGQSKDMVKKIEREDMLELTRRMTVSRTSMTRVAGSYMDQEGEIDGTFNTHFLKLSPSERGKMLAIAKEIPFSSTNECLKRYEFPMRAMQKGSFWQMLMGMKSCGLKNDALMETFYELIAEQYQSNQDYAIYVFHDRYDIPAKGKDHVRQGESEEIFEYIICAICPLEGAYEPGRPSCGFLFPAYLDHGAAQNYIDIFQADTTQEHTILKKILGVLI